MPMGDYGAYQAPSKKKPGKKKAAAPALKGNFKPGGSYNSGRAIVGAPGTKPRTGRGGAGREGGIARPTSPAGRGKGADKVAPMRPGTGTGTGYKPNSPAGRGKGGEAMGRNKSSSAQAGKFAPKKKASSKGSKY